MLTTVQCPGMSDGTERKVFQVMLKWLESWGADDVFRECVPDGGSGSRKGSAADSGEFDRRHVLTGELGTRVS